MCLPARYPHLSSTRYEGVYRYGSRLMCSMDFDFVLEGLHHEAMLRQQILHLQEYRSHGLTRLAAINVFHGQKGERDRQLRHLSMMGETIRDWEAATSSDAAGGGANTISFYEDKDRYFELKDSLTALGRTCRLYFCAFFGLSSFGS